MGRSSTSEFFLISKRVAEGSVKAKTLIDDSFVWFLHYITQGSVQPLVDL